MQGFAYQHKFSMLKPLMYITQGQRNKAETMLHAQHPAYWLFPNDIWLLRKPAKAAP